MSKDAPKVRQRKLTDYKPDPHNANLGTERGQYLVERSIEQSGAARSLVATGDDTIAAGNKTLQALVDAGIVDVLEVETDGKTVVVVKRTDWDGIEDEQARRYAFFDNRASELGLQWDAEQIVAALEDGIDLSDMFHEQELGDLAALASDVPSLDDLADTYGDGDERDFWPYINVQIDPETFEKWRTLMQSLPGDDDTDKMRQIVEAAHAALFGGQ